MLPRSQNNLCLKASIWHAELHKLAHHPYNDLDLPIKDIKFGKKSTTKFTFVVDSMRFNFDISTQKLTIKDSIWKDKKKPSWPTYSSDSVWIAYAKNHNLYVMKTKDKDSIEIQLTTDGERYYSYAANSEDTTKNKKVRTRAEWFKNSKKLYIEREDERKVKDLFVVDVLAQPRPKLQTYRYSMPGNHL
jgi:dipeptidyl-peptidase-4